MRSVATLVAQCLLACLTVVHRLTYLKILMKVVRTTRPGQQSLPRTWSQLAHISAVSCEVSMRNSASRSGQHDDELLVLDEQHGEQLEQTECRHGRMRGDESSWRGQWEWDRTTSADGDSSPCCTRDSLADYCPWFFIGFQQQDDRRLTLKHFLTIGERRTMGKEDRYVKETEEMMTRTRKRKREGRGGQGVVIWDWDADEEN